jgi:hypothetical protein
MKKILMIGLEPRVVDVAAIPGLTEESLAASLKSEEQGLRNLGFDASWCLVDLGETAAEVATAALDAKQYDLVLIGAGVRTIPERFELFEELINIVHEHAPKSKICFNTRPDDSMEAVLRWLETPTPTA